MFHKSLFSSVCSGILYTPTDLKIQGKSENDCFKPVEFMYASYMWHLHPELIQLSILSNAYMQSMYMTYRGSHNINFRSYLFPFKILRVKSWKMFKTMGVCDCWTPCHITAAVFGMFQSLCRFSLKCEVETASTKQVKEGDGAKCHLIWPSSDIKNTLQYSKGRG